MLFDILGLVLGIIGGFLGAWGGAEGTSKNWRRLGIPIFITLIALLVIQHWFVFSLLSLIAIFCIGYGVPDMYSEEGSPLGRFFYTRFDTNHLLTNIFTRGTIGILASLALISIPILRGDLISWLSYMITSIIVILVYSLLSWRSLGGFTFLKKYLTFSEFVTYYTLTTGALLLIFQGM